MMTDDKPLITIAIPCYNAERTIKQAIESALKQSWQDLEIIVCDNASQDSTAEILRSYSDNRLKVYHQSANIGMNENFRFCLEKATGQFITFLNADDYLLAESISKRYEAFQACPNVTLVTTDAVWEGARTDLWNLPYSNCHNGAEIIKISLKRGQNRIHWSVALIRTTILKNLGFSDNLFFDWILWLRLLRLGKLAHVPETLTVLTEHDNRETKRQMKLQSIHCQELQEVLDEFAHLENLSPEFLQAKAEGQYRILQNYVWAAINDFALEQNIPRLRNERANFQNLSHSLQEHLWTRLILQFPMAWKMVRQVKTKVMRRV